MLSSFFGRYAVLGLAVILLLGASAGSPARAGVDRWTNTGPFGGNVTVVAVDPHSPSTLYAGGSAGSFASNSGGGFKSTDGGASWVSFGTAYPCGGVAALAIDPATTSTLYASGNGTCKSTDGGQSWTQLANDPTTFLPGSVQSFAIDPQSTATIYAATGNSVITSTNGGQSWSAGTGLPNGPSFVIVEVDPHTPTTVYAGSNEGSSASGAGLFRSTDGGASWNAINNGITPLAGVIDVVGLAVDPQTPTTLYATTTGGLFKSTNGGSTWTKLQTIITGPIAIDPQATATLYVGGNPQVGPAHSQAGVVVSTDGGATFTPVNSGLGPLVTNAVSVNVLAINPQSPATLYAGTGSGLFATTNGGAAWTAANNGISLLEITALATDPNSATTIYAGTGSNGPAGLFKSGDGGDSWTAINNGLAQLGGGVPSITAVTVDPTSSATVYAAVAGGTLFKSTDGGNSWVESDSGITQGVSVSVITIDPLAPGTLYAAGLTLFRSTNGGSSWAVAENGLPNAGGRQGITGLSAAAVTATPPSALTLSTDGNGLFVSLDGANSWQSFDINIPGTAARRSGAPQATPAQIACAADFSGSVFFILNFMGHDFPDQLSHIFVLCVSPYAKDNHNGSVTLVNGDTFYVPLNYFNVAKATPSAVSGPQLPAGVTVTEWAEPDGASESVCEPLGPLVVNPLVPTTFYAGSGCGVLVGTNSGAQMVAMDLGLPPTLQVAAIAITPSASDLYIGSPTGGVYRYSFVDSPLAAAVLPSSRSVQTGSAATAFATLINGGPTTATGCALAPITVLPAGFSYQTTVPGTNALTGSPNTPVSIPAGGVQTFLFSFTPTQEIDPIDAQLEFSCAGTPLAAVLPGIDTLLISGSTTPVPDVVALAATPTGDGIIDIPGASGANAFAVATVNLGAGGTITATPGTGSTSLPISLAICQTVPSTGQCQATAAASVSASIDSNATPTFAIFVGGGGTVPFDPAGNRIAVQFTDATGNIRGSTSVAVRTQ